MKMLSSEGDELEIQTEQKFGRQGGSKMASIVFMEQSTTSVVQM